MKKRQKVKIPKYAFGLDQIGGLTSIAGSVASAGSALTEPGADEPPSTANGAMKVLGGAASGAAAGAALGPIGAIGGAVIGGVVGIFGAKKAKRDYEKKVAAAKEKRRVYDNTVNFNSAVANSANIQKEYEGDSEKAYTFANGGMVKNKKKTYVSEREEIADTKPTNLNLISKDNLRLNDKNYAFRKVAGVPYNRYYAETGDLALEDITGTFDKAPNNPYYISNPTHERMNRISAEFFKRGLNKDIQAQRAAGVLQEDIPAYACGKAKKCATGGNIGDSQLAYVDDGEVIRTPDGNMTEVPEQGQAEDSNLVNLPEYSTILSDKIKIKALGGKTPAQYFKSKQGKVSDSTDEYAANSTRLNKQNNEKLYAKLLDIQHIENIKRGNKQQTKSIPKYAKGKGATITKFKPGTFDIDTTKVSTFNTPTKFTANDQYSILQTKAPTFQNPVAPIQQGTPKKTKFSLGNVDFGSIASLSAPLYNLAKSREDVEEVAPIENPYAGSILSASNELSNRQYNINPIIEANRRTRNISNYNAAQANTNTGASMAMRTQNAVNEYAANADLYATKNNAENQWASEGANARMNAYSQLGQQSIASQAQAQQINRQAQAKQDDYRAAAYTQLGEWGQMQQKYRNQRRSENIGWEAMNKFLSQGYTQDEMARINALYGKR